MAEPFLSEIRLFSFTYAPQGWAQCNGQFMAINQNQALFALLGTTFGGNGQTTFALPDLRGRVPMHAGNGHILGERAGEEAHTVTATELPFHTHIVEGATSQPTAAVAAGNLWAAQTANAYATAPNSTLNAACVTPVGGSQPHENRQPFTVLNYCIALQGIFPSQN